MTINASRTRRLLWMISALQLAALPIFAVTTWFWRPLMLAAAISDIKMGDQTAAHGAPRQILPSMERLAQVWDRPLRRPLVDPPPAAPAPVPLPPAPPPVDFALVGTVAQASGWNALIVMRTGEIRVIQPGDHFGATRIEAIDEESISVIHHKQLQVLKLKRR